MVYSVKAMYKALEPRPSFSFPIKSIWKNCLQPKTMFFFLLREQQEEKF